MRSPCQKRWLTAFAVGLAAVAIVVGAAEATLRLLASHRPAGMFAPDSRLGFRLAPNFEGEMVMGGETLPVSVNALGLRYRVIEPRRPGVLRLYVLGDSFVFGHGVASEATLTGVLERTLEPPAGCTGIEVVNGGVPRYGTVQEVGLFESTVDRVQPDLVLLGVFVGNDAIDNLAGAMAGTSLRAAAGSWLDWVRMRSQLYSWLRRQRHVAGDRRGDVQRQVMRLHSVDPPAELARGLEITEAAIARLAQLTRRRGLPFAVVLIPAAAQVHTERWTAMLRQYGGASTSYDVREPNRRFAAFAAAQSLPLLDLTPALTAASAEPLYFVLHWTPRGHAVAAASVGDFLTRSGLLGQAAQVRQAWGRGASPRAVCGPEVLA